MNSQKWGWNQHKNVGLWETDHW